MVLGVAKLRDALAIASVVGLGMLYLVDASESVMKPVSQVPGASRAGGPMRWEHG
jgi:hypothetical protein